MIVLVTQKAEAKHRAPLEGEAKGAGLDPSLFRWIRIPEGRDERELWQVLHVVREEIERVRREADLERVPLVVDITHGFRHLPFLVLSALRYLQSLDLAEVQGVYYGLFVDGDAEEEPLVDLRPLLDLDRWALLASLRRATGTLLEWQALVEEASIPKGLAANLGDRLRGLEEALLLGHAREVGRTARELLEKGSGKPLRALERARPLLAPLLARALNEFQALQAPGDALTEDEVARECQLLRWYLDHGLLDQALLLAREVMVNRVLLAAGRAEQWLDYQRVRRWAEARLRGDEKAGGEAGRLWKTLCDLRNQVAHCGFSGTGAPSPPRIRRAVEKALALLEDPSAWGWITRPGTKRLLISPLGMSPGLLYTALLKTQEAGGLDGLVAVVSPETAPRLDEVLERAKETSLPTLPLQMKAGDFPAQEVQERVWRMVREWPLYREAGHAILNIAGGTEAMQYLARSLATRMAGEGVAVEEYWAVDPRPWEEQQQDPYGSVGDWKPVPQEA